MSKSKRINAVTSTKGNGQADCGGGFSGATFSASHGDYRHVRIPRMDNAYRQYRAYQEDAQ